MKTPATTSAASAIVLYSRSAFDHAQDVGQLAERLADRIRHDPGQAWAQTPGRVVAAYADLAGPSLPEVLTDLASSGVREAVVVTCMVPADPTLSSWIAGALSQWSADRGATMSVQLATPVEAAIDMIGAIETVLASSDRQDVRSTAPSLGKPGWSRVPAHARQVFVCLGARCLHRGAEPLYQHLCATLKAHRSLSAGQRRVMCARSSCLYPCNLGPVMTVHPDGVWYGELTRERIGTIVDEHFLRDRVVLPLQVHRTHRVHS